MMKNILILISLIAIFNQSLAQIGFDNYANINTIGISADTYSADLEHDLQMQMEYKKLSSSVWLNGFELSKANSINPNMINSSIFGCEASTAYQIRITLSDSTTPALNGIYTDTVTTKKLIDFTSFTTTYYVSPLGTGTAFSMTNPGSLQSALGAVQAGERILLLAGTYSIGSLELNQSGSMNSPITIQGEEGQTVILDGSESIPTWSVDAGTGGYKATVTNKHCNVVIADGVRLYPHKSVKELKYHKIVWESNCRDAAVDGFFRSGNSNTLRLNFRDHSDPNLKDIKVGVHNSFMTLENVNWVRFNNLNFKYYGSKNRAAIILKNANNIQLDHCTFGYNDIGIKIEENTNNLIVDNCEFYDNYGDWNFWRMKASYQGVYLYPCSGNNFIADNLPGSDLVNLYNYRGLEKGGIFVNGDYSGRGIIIKKSSFHDMVQGLSISPQTYWVDTTGRTAEVDFYENEVYNCSEDGLEADTYPRNVRIWRNEFHDVNAAISIAEGADGPVYIFNNIFYDFVTDTTHIAAFGDISRGRPLKTNAGEEVNTGHVFFMHNTVYAREEHYSMDILRVNSSWNKLKFINNILQSENQNSLRIRTGTDSFGPFFSDYNCFYRSSQDASGIIYIEENASTFVYTTIPSFSTAFSVDSNSLNVDPLFVNALNNDFHLSNSSLLIDAGILIDGLNEGFNGVGPDMGALESSFTVGTNELDLKNAIKIYPNPLSTENSIHIQVLEKYTHGEVLFYTITGQLIKKVALVSSLNTIDLNEINPGIYVLSIRIDGKIATKKIIKS